MKYSGAFCNAWTSYFTHELHSVLFAVIYNLTTIHVYMLHVYCWFNIFDTFNLNTYTCVIAVYLKDWDI